jgi:vacuolar-type H+-ATPase subunit I/STV1
MALDKKMLEFYDKMLDGRGIAKLINVGQRKGLRRDQIRAAAEMVYEEHIDTGKSFIATPLLVAKEIFRLARELNLEDIQKLESKDAANIEELLRRISKLERKLKPFRHRLYEWFPNEIYFY